MRNPMVCSLLLIVAILLVAVPGTSQNETPPGTAHGGQTSSTHIKGWLNADAVYVDSVFVDSIYTDSLKATGILATRASLLTAGLGAITRTTAQVVASGTTVELSNLHSVVITGTDDIHIIDGPSGSNPYYYLIRFSGAAADSGLIQNDAAGNIKLPQSVGDDHYTFGPGDILMGYWLTDTMYIYSIADFNP